MTFKSYLSRIYDNFPRHTYDFLIMSSLDLIWMFLSKYMMRFFLLKTNLEATIGHFLMNSVMILIRMISTSFFLSLNSRSFTMDFKNKFYSLLPCSSAAWWITEAAQTPYLYLFFTIKFRLMMKSKILSKIL